MSPPQRVFFQFSITFSRVAWSILDCARRTSTFLSCAFREQEDDRLPSLCWRAFSASCNVRPGGVQEAGGGRARDRMDRG
jgi:hypothetical protein